MSKWTYTRICVAFLLIVCLLANMNHTAYTHEHNTGGAANDATFDAEQWAEQHRLSAPTVLLVLAGGVDSQGNPNALVDRRLRAAAALYYQTPNLVTAVVCNGGGTSHKPRFIDDQGYSLPESRLMAKRLMALGVPQSKLFTEDLSADTIGNALLVRLLHVEPRVQSFGRRLLVITSEFHRPRAQKIYEWAFRLLPLPGGEPFIVEVDGVPDQGLGPAMVAAVKTRRERERKSLETFQQGVVVQLRQLSDAHQFLFQQHGAYVLRTEPRASDKVDSDLESTY